MSLGYAERLSFREDLGGRLGDPEILEQAQEVVAKVEQLTDLVRAVGSCGVLCWPLPVFTATHATLPCRRATGQGSNAGGGIHGGRHLHSMRHPRLPRPQRRVDGAARWQAVAQGQGQLPVCPAQPDTHGPAGAAAGRQTQVHVQPECGQFAPAIRWGRRMRLVTPTYTQKEPSGLEVMHLLSQLAIPPFPCNRQPS